jgi:hypothetical protein
MGWSSANPIFDRTIRTAINLGIKDSTLTALAQVLIEQLQDGDWDTEDESVELFEDYPEVLEAFRNQGVRIACKCQCCGHEGER